MDLEQKSDFYLEILGQRSTVQAREWFNRVYEQIQHPVNFNRFSAAYAGIRRRVGTFHFEFERYIEEFLPRSFILLFNGRTLDELGRACLLLRALESLSEEHHSGFISKVYQQSDTYEQQALLRSLMILPCPPRYLMTAVESCRTNVKTVFEAIACENTYPFHYFPDSNFNQMVLKALSMGYSLKRIVGMDKRLNPQLHQMVHDFANERKIAKRPLPEDIDLILSHHEYKP